MKIICYFAWMLTALIAMYLIASYFLQGNWQHATFFLVVFVFADIKMNRLYNDIDVESRRSAGLDRKPPSNQPPNL